jgi:hypothetical protein
MNYSHVTARFQAFASVSLAMAVAGCNALSAPAADSPVIYREAGDAWTTRKRDVHLYQCVNASMVCRGPASHVNVIYHCRCE